VRKGELRLGAAKEVIKKPKEEQQAELDRIKRNERQRQSVERRRGLRVLGKDRMSPRPTRQ
jgi:hypothetical protein